VNGTRWMRAWLVMSVITAVIFASGARGANAPRSPSSEPSSPVVVELHRDTFDWKAAGVGAAATLAVVVIAFGLVLALRGGRSQGGPKEVSR
jgi:predicted cation transporter